MSEAAIQAKQSDLSLELDQVKYDANGLVPAVIQDSRTGTLLMLGYMNQEALRRTLESGKVWFWSRSRQVFWLKGETSGNYFAVQEIYGDCDADAILVKVVLKEGGVACHTGRYSCFCHGLSGFKPPQPGGDGCA